MKNIKWNMDMVTAERITEKEERETKEEGRIYILESLKN